jgi:nucleoside-diphosphate-sugar epimerase
LPGILLNFLYFFVPDKLDKLFGSFEFENNNTKRILNYKPTFSTEEGIRRMVKFYLENKQQ